MKLTFFYLPFAFKYSIALDTNIRISIAIFEGCVLSKIFLSFLSKGLTQEQKARNPSIFTP